MTEIYCRRVNLLFYGIKETPDENVENLLRDTFAYLGLSQDEVATIALVNAHRLPRRNAPTQPNEGPPRAPAPRAIIAKFVYMMDRNKILAASDERQRQRQPRPANASTPNITETEGITSPKFSFFVISDPSKEYQLCDQIEIVIEARDEKNQRKLTGGDYFRVRLYNNELPAGASADRDVEYVGDGRYKAYFTLRWAGQAFVRVILVHPAEVVHLLQKAQFDLPSRYGYTGRFQRNTDGKLVTEDTLCNIIPPGHEPVCDYSNHKARGPWFCSLPPTLNCSDFAWTCANKKYARKLLAQADQSKTLSVGPAVLLAQEWRIRRLRQVLLEEWNTIPLHHGQDLTRLLACMRRRRKMRRRSFKKAIPVHGSQYVNVTNKYSKHSGERGCPNKNLPPCRIGSLLNSSSVAAGYFFKGRWYSNYCRLRPFESTEAYKCLRNKTLYFHGDSTARQYFEFLVSNLEELIPNPPTKQSNWKVGPSLAESTTFNFTVHYRHHGYPIRNNWTNATEVKYIVDALDELHATADTVYTFTLWAHLTTVNISHYEDRARQIRAAVERLHKRSPKTLIVLKSANTRTGSILAVSDWYARSLDLKMRQVFANYSNIGFIDQWSMAVGFSNKDMVHPVSGVISSGISTLLSYMCPNE
ncbi:NXPE family member 3-like [Diadema setosum]|uniref:NXPE family member 3-like n=1 Tax=Diadema setosum TaxID=31175 RepID=UPI003B3A7125